MRRWLVLVLVLPALAGCLAAEETEGLDTDSEDVAGEPADAHPHPDVNQTGYTGFDGEPEDCARIENPGPFDLSASLVTGYQTRTLDIVLATDQSFRDLYGKDWEATAYKVAAAADEIYQRELELAVNVTAVVSIPLENLTVEENLGPGLDAAQSQKIIDDTRAYFNEYFQDLDRDLVYTLVGTSTAGAIAGQVDCIGGARFKDVAYGWGEGLNLEGALLEAGPAQLGQATGLKVILHEMAHLLGAHHHYQTCGPHAAQSGPEDALGACSIMTNAVDFASFYFSVPNKSAIRGYSDEVDL